LTYHQDLQSVFRKSTSNPADLSQHLTPNIVIPRCNLNSDTEYLVTYYVEKSGLLLSGSILEDTMKIRPTNQFTIAPSCAGTAVEEVGIPVRFQFASRHAILTQGRVETRNGTCMLKNPVNTSSMVLERTIAKAKAAGEGSYSSGSAGNTESTSSSSMGMTYPSAPMVTGSTSSGSMAMMATTVAPAAPSTLSGTGSTMYSTGSSSYSSSSSSSSPASPGYYRKQLRRLQQRYAIGLAARDGGADLTRGNAFASEAPSCQPNENRACGDNLASRYSEDTSSGMRVIQTNAVPNHRYNLGREEPNPRQVCEQPLEISLPLSPEMVKPVVETVAGRGAAATTTTKSTLTLADTGLGIIGILKTGALLYNQLSIAGGEDDVAVVVEKA
ncbi:unnamed protein product, partial [Amoebophrya sp. A25]